MQQNGVYLQNQAMDDVARTRQMLIGGLESMIHDFNFTEMLMSHLVLEKNLLSKDAFKAVIASRIEKHRQSVELAHDKLNKLEDLVLNHL